MIHLRPPEPQDADPLFPMIFRAKVTDTILWEGPESLEAYREGLASKSSAIVRGEEHFFTIVESATGRPAGSCDLRPYKDHPKVADLGIWIGEPFQGKTYGTQAVRELVRYGFEKLGLKRLEAKVFVGNFASRRIFEKNGFSLEATLPQAAMKRGKSLDEWLFARSP